MNDAVATIRDIDLSRQDIQALSGPDAITAFFARLGYNTDARTAQTAGNLGFNSHYKLSIPVLYCRVKYRVNSAFSSRAAGTLLFG
jgi:hypothetical protein